MIPIQYSPKSLNHKTVLFHKPAYQFLDRFVSTPQLWPSSPHVIISGPKGCGKHTLLRLWLQRWLDEPVQLKLLLKQETKLSDDIQILCSPYHFELSHQCCSGPEQIKLIQYFVKQYSQQNILRLGRSQKHLSFRLIVLHQIHEWSLNAQHAMRRILEQNYGCCRFIFTTDKYHLVSMPLRSRCLSIHLHKISKSDLHQWLLKTIFPRINLSKNGVYVDTRDDFQMKKVKDAIGTLIQRHNGELMSCMIGLQTWFYRFVSQTSVPDTIIDRSWQQCLDLWNIMNESRDSEHPSEIHQQLLILKQAQLLPRIHQHIVWLLKSGFSCSEIWQMWVHFLLEKHQDYECINRETQAYQMYNYPRENIHDLPRLQLAIFKTATI